MTVVRSGPAFLDLLLEQRVERMIRESHVRGSYGGVLVGRGVWEQDEEQAVRVSPGAVEASSSSDADRCIVPSE
jgi:hypothetical protein